MNKYILRTSLVWIAVLAAVVALLFYRPHLLQHAHLHNSPAASDSTLAAAGPSIAGENTTAATGENTTAATGENATSATPAQKMETPLAPLQLTPERMQSIGVRTGTVEYKRLNDEIRATGTVDIDERLVSYVQVRFPGYIRKVFANATYQYVRKGDPLFTIYSPDLVATQQEYLLARQNQKALSASTVDGVATGAAALSAAAEQRLQQWQVPQSELQKLRDTGKTITDLTINSPASGYITEYNALPNMYVDPSTRLYTVVDLSRVWVNAQVFQNDVGRLKPGDATEVTVDAYPGRTFHGRVEDILPQVDLSTRTVKVRLVIQNPGLKLKPGMYVNVDFKSPLGRQLVIPASAVFQTGTRQVVFLDHGNGNLEPRDVVLGPRSDESYVVLKGLKVHQQIVTSANFLIDSESQLQAAAGSFMPPSGTAGTPSESASSAAPQGGIDFTTAPAPPQKGANTLRVKLTGPDKAPVVGASVTVRFFMAAMPEMGMGAMSVLSQMKDEGNGNYQGTASLGSGGTWQVTITAEKSGHTVATKQLRINVTGGM